MTGPMDEDDLKPIRHRVTMRSVFLLQSVLEERLSDAPRLGEPDVPAVETAGSTSQVFANLLNENRPHSSIGNLTPSEFAAQLNETRKVG